MLARVHLRLIVFSVLMAGLILSFSGFMIMRGYAERNLTLVAQTVSYTIEPAVVFGDVDAIHEGIAMVAGINDVRSLEILDANGALLARWDHPQDGFVARVEDVAGHLIWPDPAVDLIERAGQVVGEVRVYGGLGGFLRFLQAAALVSVSCLGLTILATQMLARRLREDVLAPLARVTEVAHEVRTKRTLGQRLPASGIFEIDRFGQDFNALLDELEGWRAGLEMENQELARQATHDELTGLGNRALLERKLDDAISEAARLQARFAVLYIDANRFKEVNDRHGHEAGDVILKTIAARLLGSIRSNDSAFRQGGDEFAILVGAPVSRNDVARIVERITASMQPEISLPGGAVLRASVSIGSALYPEDGPALADLMRRADAEMYADKQRRRQTEQE